MSERSLYEALAERVGQMVVVRRDDRPDDGEGWELAELGECRSQGEIRGAECFEFSALFRPPEPRPDGLYRLELQWGASVPALFLNPVVSRQGSGAMQLIVSSSDPALVGAPPRERED